MTLARGAVVLVTVLAALTLLISALVSRPTPVTRAQHASEAESIAPERFLSAARIAALPEARYDAVIAGLLPSRQRAEAHTAYHLRNDAALYGVDRATPVGRLAALNFLGEPTVVVPVEYSGDWVRILTPARQRLPSDDDSAVETADGSLGAPAQSAAWVRADALVSPTNLAVGIVVSISAQTLRITGAGDRTWPVGVGAPGTPTPTGVSGYLQARYRDAAQGQAENPVQLTSLHSTATDEPFGGVDGGLIGIHFEPSASGAVSHGCIRVPADALAAIDALPLGTLITIEG